MNYRFMSNNQWKCDTNNAVWRSKGEDCSAAVRAVGFARTYAESKPDIIGLQEVSALMADELIQNLQKLGLRYSLLWGRDTPILYRPDLFELIDSDFALYPDEVPGYEGCFNNQHTKSWNVGIFRTKESGKVFAFMSTHLWWMLDDPNSRHYQKGSDAARVYQVDIAIDRLEAFCEQYRCPAIIMGDFNADYDSSSAVEAVRRGFSNGHDIAVEYATNENGYHYCGNDGYTPYIPQAFEKGIDHILLKGFDKDAVRRYDRFTPAYFLPLSDHFPVYVDMVL